MAAFSADISRVERRLQKLQSSEEKGLGSRTIKLCAAVCCVNQERPNAGLLLSFGNGWEKTLIRIKCSCCTTIPNTHTFTHTDLSPLASVIDIVWHTCKDTNGRVFFLDSTSKRRIGRRNKQPLCLSVIHPG